MKRIIVSACLLLTFVCGILALEQAQKRKTPRGGRGKPVAANRPPKIKLFASSSSTAIIPCPYLTATTVSDCALPGRMILKLTTEASDPDKDSLRYEYSVTAGQITGEGANVVWNLTGNAPGPYMAKVVVKDGRGRTDSKSTQVTVLECSICPVPCPNIDVSCPEHVEEGQAIVFSVNISGGLPELKPIPNWSVSSGTIIKGQGTYKIEVDTKGLAGQQVTATVDIGGILPECESKVSCVTQIRKQDARGK